MRGTAGTVRTGSTVGTAGRKGRKPDRITKMRMIGLMMNPKSESKKGKSEGTSSQKAGNSPSSSKKKAIETVAVEEEEEGGASAGASASVKAQGSAGDQRSDGKGWTRVLEGYERGGSKEEDKVGYGNGNVGRVQGRGWGRW